MLKVTMTSLCTFLGLGCSLPAKVLYDSPAERYIRQKKVIHVIKQKNLDKLIAKCKIIDEKDTTVDMFC